MDAFRQTFYPLLHRVTPKHMAIARAVCAALALLMVNSPWLPLLNSRLDGSRLVKMLGMWFSTGMPYTLVIFIITALLTVGLAAGFEIIMVFARRALAERRLNKPLGYILLALSVLLIFLLTNRFTLSLTIILSPALVIVYEGISIVSLIPALKPGHRARISGLLIAVFGMWAGLVWLANGSGGAASSGWGYWGGWVLLAAGLVIEALDFWLEIPFLEE